MRLQSLGATKAVTSQGTRTPNWPVQPATKPRAPCTRHLAGICHTTAR